MPLFTAPDSQHTHHHGLLAGVSAGAMAVLAVLALLLMVWHRISGAVGAAVLVIVWAVTAAMVGLVGAAAVYVALWLRHRARHPETLSARPAGTPAAAVPAQPPAAALPAREAKAIEAMRRGYAPTVVVTDAEEIQP